MKTKSLVIIAIMAALMAVLAPLSIPTSWGVSYSLGTLALYIVIGLVDFKHGLLAIATYIFMGACCIPVFANYLNLYQCIAGSTFGYVVGYIPCALIAGLIIDKTKKLKAVMYPLAFILGTLLLYLTGTIWFSILTDYDFVTSLSLCVIPYIWFDMIKVAVAVSLIIVLRPRIAKIYQPEYKKAIENSSM